MAGSGEALRKSSTGPTNRNHAALSIQRRRGAGSAPEALPAGIDKYTSQSDQLAAFPLGGMRPATLRREASYSYGPIRSMMSQWNR